MKVRIQKSRGIVGKRRRKKSLQTKDNRTGGRRLGVILYGRTEGRVRDRSGWSPQGCRKGRLGSETVAWDEEQGLDMRVRRKGVGRKGEGSTNGAGSRRGKTY